jgi:hypothetical protein
MGCSNFSQILAGLSKWRKTLSQGHNLKHYLPLLNLDFGKVAPKKFV